MSRYRKVDPRIWNDAKFRELGDNAKLLFLFLLTHPHMTALGAMRATPGGLAEELGWTVEAFREAFRQVIAKAMAEHDERACLVALPNFLRYNAPESPNVVKAWVGALDLLPECELKNVAIQRAQAYVDTLTKGFGEAFREAFAKAMPIQEQEQEQEQDKTSPLPTRMPRQMSLTAEWRAIAEQLRPEWDAKRLQRVFLDFRDHYASKGEQRADWGAAWQKWVRNERDEPGSARSTQADRPATRGDQRAANIAKLTGRTTDGGNTIVGTAERVDQQAVLPAPGRVREPGGDDVGRVGPDGGPTGVGRIARAV
jgi:hypothetical protein